MNSTTMKSIHIVLLIALTALILAILMTVPAHAETGKPKKPAAAEKAKKKKGSAPKFVNSSSQETTAERDRRLYRECKGRPNAGACLGYAG
jgi:flagellar basal body-associated protein FliL